MQKTKLDCFLTLSMKINSKWIKLNVRPETMKHLAENINNTLFELILTIFFWMFSPLEKATKAKKKTKQNKWDYIKLKNFHTVKEIINKIEDSLLNKRRYLIRSKFPE